MSNRDYLLSHELCGSKSLILELTHNLFNFLSVIHNSISKQSCNKSCTRVVVRASFDSHFKWPLIYIINSYLNPQNLQHCSHILSVTQHNYNNDWSEIWPISYSVCLVTIYNIWLYTAPLYINCIMYSNCNI